MPAALVKKGQVVDWDRIIPSEREKKFFDIYVECGRNARKATAVMREFENKPPYPTEATLAARASEWARRPGFQKLINTLKAEIQKRTELVMERRAITKDRVLEELVNIAFFKPTDVMTWKEGEGIATKSSDDITEESKSALADVVEIDGKKIRLKSLDKVGALKLLGTHLGLFENVQKHEHKHVAVSYVIEK